MYSPRPCAGLLLALLLAGSVGAQGGDDATVEADFGVASRRVFRGIERAGSSAQASVEIARDEFRAGISASQPFAADAGGEMTLSAAYRWKTDGQLSFEVSAAHYWFAAGSPDRTRFSNEGGLTANLPPIQGFAPSVSYFHDFRLESDTWQAAVAHSFPLTSLGAFLDCNVFAGTASGRNWRPDSPGPARHDDYAWWGAEAHVPYRVGPHATVIAGLHFTHASNWSPINGPFGRSAGTNLWVTLGVSLDF